MAKWCNWPKQYPERFWGIALFIFGADHLVNYWIDWPVFMASAPFLMIAMALQLKDYLKSWLLICTVFIALFLLKFPLQHSIALIDWTDLLQLIFSVTSVFFLIEYRKTFTYRTASVLAIFSLLLFLPYFLGFNSNFGMDQIHLRIYRSGLFRVPHVAAYLFGFLSLAAFKQFFRFKRAPWVFTGVIFITLSIYTGVRTVTLALILGGLLALLFKRNYRALGICFAWVLFALLAFAPVIQPFFEGTLFDSFFNLINQVVYSNQPSSRELIWSVWWEQMQDFNGLDWLLGRTTSASHQANIIALNYDIWFHNDFLQIIYAYGVLGCFTYLFFWGVLIKQLTQQLDFWGIAGVFGFFFCAFFNGFYTYYPLFTLVPVIALLSDSQPYSGQ